MTTSLLVVAYLLNIYRRELLLDSFQIQIWESLHQSYHMVAFTAATAIKHQLTACGSKFVAMILGLQAVLDLWLMHSENYSMNEIHIKWEQFSHIKYMKCLGNLSNITKISNGTTDTILYNTLHASQQFLGRKWNKHEINIIRKTILLYWQVHGVWRTGCSGELFGGGGFLFWKAYSAYTASNKLQASPTFSTKSVLLTVVSRVSHVMLWEFISNCINANFWTT